MHRLLTVFNPHLFYFMIFLWFSSCKTLMDNWWWKEHKTNWWWLNLIGRATFSHCVSALWLYHTLCFHSTLSGTVCFCALSFVFFLSFFSSTRFGAEIPHAETFSAGSSSARPSSVETHGAKKPKCRNIQCANMAKHCIVHFTIWT